MNIGFDAKRAFNNFTGLGNYSRTLVETLAHYFPKNEYHLFTPKVTNDPRLDFLKHYPNIYTHIPTGAMASLSAFWRSYFVKDDISREKIDIFHGLSHELPLSIPKGVKTVVTMHDLIHERYPEFYPFFDRKIYTWKFKSACEKADVVVAISEATKQDLINFYQIDAGKIKVIYQSCHPQFYLKESAQQSDLLDSILPPQYILYVGTVNERKNLLGLVKAMQLIDKQLGMKLVVIGDGGEYFKKVKKYIADNKLEDIILFLKKIPFSDFPILYKKAKALVLPSFQEGFGIPIIEALWSGCPVITSIGSCFPEAAGPDSIYINPHDSEHIADAINHVCTNEVHRDRMILRGLEYVQQFHEKIIGEQWEALYRSLM